MSNYYILIPALFMLSFSQADFVGALGPLLLTVGVVSTVWGIIWDTI